MLELSSIEAIGHPASLIASDGRHTADQQGRRFPRTRPGHNPCRTEA
jgi:hypothetical protein